MNGCPLVPWTGLEAGGSRYVPNNLTGVSPPSSFLMCDWWSVFEVLHFLPLSKTALPLISVLQVYFVSLSLLFLSDDRHVLKFVDNSIEAREALAFTHLKWVSRITFTPPPKM